MGLLLKIYPQTESGLQLEFVLLICARTKVNREAHDWQVSWSSLHVWTLHRWLPHLVVWWPVPRLQPEISVMVWYCRTFQLTSDMCFMNDIHLSYCLGTLRHVSWWMLMWRSPGGLAFRRFIIASLLLAQSDGPLQELASQASVFIHSVYPFNIYLLQHTMCQHELRQCNMVSRWCFSSAGTVRK